MSKLTKIKWIGPNNPIIILNRNDLRVSLSKEELMDLRIEINEFIEYYADSFTEGRIGYADECSWPNEGPNHTGES